MKKSGQCHVPAALLSGNIPDIHGIGGWVGPESIHTFWRWQKSLVCRDSNPGSFSPQRSYTEYAIPAHSSMFLCYCLFRGSHRQHFDSKQHLTFRHRRKYTRTNSGIYNVSTSTTKRAIVRDPGQFYQAPLPKRSGYPAFWVAQHLDLRVRL
jgi:hypothetical protein